MIGVGVAVFIWASSHHAFPVPDATSNTAYADDTQANMSISDAPTDAPVEVIYAPTDNSAAATVSDNEGPLTDNRSDEATTLYRDRPPEAVPEPVKSEADDLNRQGSREIDQAIDDATRIALQTGETAKWHKNGQKGFVVVSGPTLTGDRTCRSVAWTDNTSRSNNVT